MTALSLSLSSVGPISTRVSSVWPDTPDLSLTEGGGQVTKTAPYILLNERIRYSPFPTQLRCLALNPSHQVSLDSLHIGMQGGTQVLTTLVHGTACEHLAIISVFYIRRTKKERSHGRPGTLSTKQTLEETVKSFTLL